MSEQPPETPAGSPTEAPREPPTEPPAPPAAPSAPPAAPPAPPPFAPVVREPWVNPSRRRHLAGVGAVIALVFFGAGIGSGIAIGDSGSHPGIRIQRGPAPGFGLPGRGIGPNWNGQGHPGNGNAQPQAPSTSPSTAPSASPSA